MEYWNMGTFMAISNLQPGLIGGKNMLGDMAGNFCHSCGNVGMSIPSSNYIVNIVTPPNFIRAQPLGREQSPEVFFVLIEFLHVNGIYYFFYVLSSFIALCRKMLEGILVKRQRQKEQRLCAFIELDFDHLRFLLIVVCLLGWLTICDNQL